MDKIIRISDKGCFSAKIVAFTVKQGFELIASMKLNEQYRKLLFDAWQRGQDFTLLDYLSISQARIKEPEKQDRYYGLEVESSLTYGIKEYPMRFIFIRSVRKAHQRQRLMDGKIKRDRNRREKHIAKIEAELDILKEKVGKPYYQNPKKLQAKIDKIIKRYAEGKFLIIELQTSKEFAVSLDYNWDEAAVSQAAKLDGIYLLGTTLNEYSMGTVFSLFKEQH